jgi:hypothetical protein
MVAASSSRSRADVASKRTKAGAGMSSIEVKRWAASASAARASRKPWWASGRPVIAAQAL